jgi:hypothetical protein
MCLCIVLHHCEDEQLVDDLIARKCKEKMNVPDSNFPDRADLEVYKCWDSTEWEDTDMGIEEMNLRMDGILDEAQTKAMLKDGAALFRPDTTLGIKPTGPEDTVPNPKKRGRGKACVHAPVTPGAGSAAASSAPGTPVSESPSTRKTPLCPLRTARSQGSKQIAQLGVLLQDVASWPAKLVAQSVPDHLVSAMTQTSVEWDTKSQT